MKRILSITLTILVSLVTVSMVEARTYQFRSVNYTKPDGRWYSASISCYNTDDTGAVWNYLVTGYDNRKDPGSSRSDIQKHIDSLPPLPTSRCTEWKVLDETWKKFWEPPLPKKGIITFLPAILTAGKQEYKTQSTNKVRKGFYSASITCLGGRWWRLARSYSELPIPNKEAQPKIFQTLKSMQLPTNRSCSTNEEWHTFQNQWVWFKEDGSPLYP